jgi:hypothetical protein
VYGTNKLKLLINKRSIETLGNINGYANICAKIIFHLDEDDSNDESSKKDMKLDGSIISLEVAPLTKGIRVSNIPPGTSSDDIRYEFSNKKIGGGQVTDMMLDKRNGVANVYFEKTSGMNLTYCNERFTQILNRFQRFTFSGSDLEEF